MIYLKINDSWLPILYNGSIHVFQLMMLCSLKQHCATEWSHLLTLLREVKSHLQFSRCPIYYHCRFFASLAQPSSCFLKCGTSNLSRNTCSSLPHFQLRVFSISYFVRLLTLCCGNVLGKNPTLTPQRGRVSLSAGWWTCYSTLMPAQLMSHWIPEGKKWSGVSFPLKGGRLTCLRISLTWEIRWGSSSMRDQI